MATRIIEAVDNALFFTSDNGDRPYTARDFVSYLGAAVGNGIIDLLDTGGTDTGPFCVSGVSNLQATVNPGTALLGGQYGYMARQTSSQDIEFIRPSGSSQRWDRVVLHLDNTFGNRTISFKVIEGVVDDPQPSDATTGLTRNDVTNGGVYELLLFDVLVTGDTVNTDITINYDNTPYVLYETKTNKVTNTLTGKDTDIISYVTPKTVIDYTMSRAGGTSYAATGNQYFGGYSLYDVASINAKSNNNLYLYAGSSNNVQVIVNTKNVTHDLNTSSLHKLTYFDKGARFQEGAAGYGLYVETGSAIFDGEVQFNSVVNSSITFKTGSGLDHRILQGKNDDGHALGAKQLNLLSSPSTSAGTTVNLATPLDVISYGGLSQGAKTIKIFFTSGTRGSAPNYELSQPMLCAELNIDSLLPVSGNLGSDNFVAQHSYAGGTDWLFTFKVRWNWDIDGSGNPGLEITSPKKRYMNTSSFSDTTIYINEILWTY